MKLSAALYGLLAATGALSEACPGDENDYPPLKSEGPYALHVKGKGNSSIDGYLYAVQERPSDIDPDSGISVLHYRPVPEPVAFNSSYRFYFNSSAGDPTFDLGFAVTDITASNSSNYYKGKAMFWTYFSDSNVALLELGEGADPYNTGMIGFGKEGKAYLYGQHDDSKAVVGKEADYTIVSLYDGWAICWQTRYTISGFTLSWITSGKPHNPTCERVDMTRLKL